MTQEDQRKSNKKDHNHEKAMERHNNKEAAATVTDLKLKEATIMGMKGAAIKQWVTTMATSVSMIEKQIELLEKTKTALVQSWVMKKLWS